MSASRRARPLVSTPSAVTVRPRLRARSIVERTIAASLSLVIIAVTNERSILISSTGSRWSCTSEEKPVPKSSIARPTPIVRSSSSTAIATRPLGHRAALGDLELQLRRVDAGVGEQRPDQPGQLRVEQAARRDVDRHRAASGPPPPRRPHCASAWRRTTSVSAGDQAGLLGERDEAVGADAPERRVLPARQRLDAARRGRRAAGTWAGTRARARPSRSRGAAGAASIRRSTV